jgi:alkylhydroperoxidase family enzyme
MSFDLADAVLPVPDDVRAGLRREWRRLAEPGTWLSGQERVAVAREARAARTFTDAHTELDPLLIEAAQSVSAAADLIDGEWVADLRSRGVTIEQYLEVVGVVSRLSAVDSYARGVGSVEEPLPEPIRGEPTRERNPHVRWRKAFVPTHPKDTAPYALSAVPTEDNARDQLHARLYLSTEQSADFAYQGTLSRAQTELLAARVSFLNDCFY